MVLTIRRHLFPPKNQAWVNEVLEQHCWGTEGGSADAPGAKGTTEPWGKARDISSDRQVPLWLGTGLPAASETLVLGSPECSTWRCPVGTQTRPFPWHYNNTLHVCLEMPPLPGSLCLCREMQGSTFSQGRRWRARNCRRVHRVTQLQRNPCGTSSCVWLRALAPFQQLAEAAGDAAGQHSSAPGSAPTCCQQTPPAAEGNLCVRQDAAGC